MVRSPWLARSAMVSILLVGACESPPPEEKGSELETVEVTMEALIAGSATTADGVEITYATKGSGEPTLVFIHGWSCERSYWSEQLDEFSRDHRVVAVDLSGHGDSGRHPGIPRLEDFGVDIEAVVSSLELPKVILIGHSMGGPAALDAALRLPERTVGVILVDSLHDPDFKFVDDSWSDLLASYRQDFVGTCQRFVQSMFLAESDAALAQRVVQDMCSAPPEVAIPLLEVFPDYDAAGALRDLKAPLRSINAANMPTEAEHFRHYVQDYDLAVQEGVGHFLMMEKPEAFNALLRRWVEELEGSSPASS